MASGPLCGLVSVVGAVLAFHLPPSLTVVQAQGWAFAEDLGNFRCPWTLQWKVPKPSCQARPSVFSLQPLPCLHSLRNHMNNNKNKNNSSNICRLLHPLAAPGAAGQQNTLHGLNASGNGLSMGSCHWKGFGDFSVPSFLSRQGS